MQRLVLTQPVFCAVDDVAEHLKRSFGVVAAFVFEQQVDQERLSGTRMEFEEDIGSVPAQATVGLIGGDDAERVEVELFEQLWREYTGQQLARVAGVVCEPCKVCVMNVLWVVRIHALIKSG